MESTNLLENVGSTSFGTVVSQAFDTLNENFGAVNSLTTFGNGSGTGTSALDQGLATILETTSSFGTENNLLLESSHHKDSSINTSTTQNALIDKITGELLGNAGLQPFNAPSQGTLLETATSIAADYLLDFQNSSDYLDDLKLAFGDNVTAKTATDALSALISGNAELSLEVVDFEGHGAFSEDLNTVFLSESFVSQNATNPENIAVTLLEEWGHYLDTVFNESDTTGDEGEIFANLVKEFNFDIDALRSENDHTKITIGNTAIEVEQDFGSVYLPTSWIIFRSVRGSILAFKRDSTVNALTDIYYRDASQRQGQFIENVQAPRSIFNGQFSLTTSISNSRRTQIGLDGQIRFRSGFIQPRLDFNTPNWTRIQ